MKILDVSPRPMRPRDRGAKVRIDGLLRGLSREHHVRQFVQTGGVELRARSASSSPSYTEFPFSSPVSDLAVAVGRRSWVRAPILAGIGLRLTRPPVLRELLAWADVVLIEFPWQFEACRGMSPNGRLVYASHNVEAVKFPAWSEAVGGPFTSPLWCSLIDRFEGQAVRSADLVLAVSEADRVEFVRRYGADPEHIVVIPNGADTRAYRPARGSERAAAKRALGLPDRPTVLFAGSDHPANIPGLRWIERLARRTDRLTFLVTGLIGSYARNGGRLVVTGVLDDFGLCLRAADMSLCPIEYGGGTKIKLLESLAAGLPTIAFAESLRGLEIEDGEHVLTAAKTEDALLASLERLATDAELARRLSRNGRAVVADHHDWEKIASRLGAALQSL